MWIEPQGERYILYVGAATATVFNPLTGRWSHVEWSYMTSRSRQNGVSEHD